MTWTFDTNLPIYLQISKAIKLQIVTEQLAPGEQLPTVRDLAETAGVNPNTVQRALADLETEGLVYTVRTTGRFVTQETKQIAQTRSSLAQDEIKQFVTSMLKLGFQTEDLCQQIQHYLKGEPHD